MIASIDGVSTFLLKAVIIVLGIAVLGLCVLLFPMIYGELWEAPEFAAVIVPALVGLFLTPAPFFYGLFQAFRLLRFIDANKAFSDASIKALGNIRNAAIIMSALYAACMPLAYVFAELDDAPGVIIVGAAIVAAPLVVATFAAVLRKLIRSGLAMKVENDLTI